MDCTYISKKRFYFAFLFCTFLSFYSFSQDPFTIRKDATRRSKRCFTITSDANNKAGAVWFKDKLDLSQPLELNFVIYMGDKDANGADGIAFVMHNDPLDTLGVGAFGEEGGGLGFSRHTSQGPEKITPSVAIEFDTWNNGASSYDIAEDHTAVVYNGDVHNNTQLIKDKDGNMVYQTPIKPNPPFSVQNVENDECYQYQITWDPATQELKLFTDGNIVFTHTGDLINNVFGGVTSLRYGFTGSTGGARNEQTICLFGGNTPPFAADDYATTLANTPVIVNITNNDYDPDGDDLLKSVVLDYPKNGLANLIGVDTIEYIPNATFVGRDSLRYFTCDVNSIKCYAKCDTATVYIDVECPPAIDILAAQISPNEKCEDAKPNNGAVKAYYLKNAPTDNLTAHWSLDDGTGAIQAKDHANTNHGTLFNFTNPWVTTELGGGLQFDGANDYVAIDNFSYNTNTNTEVTVALWVKTTNGGNQVLVSFDRNAYWRLEVNGNGGGSGQVGWDVQTNAGTKDFGSTKRIDDGQWHHVASVFDNGAMKIYIDGIQDAATSSGTTFGNGITRYGFLGVGSEATTFNGTQGPTSYFKGSMDDVRLYDRALSAGEISNLYNAGNPNVPVANPDLSFNWYKGNAVKAIADYTGSVITNLEEGIYTVVAKDNLTGCTSNPEQITINRTKVSPDAIIWQVAPFTSCGLADGILQSAIQVLVSGSLITTGYDFVWYDNDFILTGDVVAVGPVAVSLNAQKYAVVVTNQSSGCDTIISSEVASNVTYPTVTGEIIQHITTCSNPTAGKVKASVNGGTLGYLFNWYKGTVEKSITDYTGSQVDNLAPGDYTVTATNIITQCTSDPVVLTIEDQTEPPVPVTTVVSTQKSCDLANPTGALSAVVDLGSSTTTSGYSFYWYKGANNSVPANSAFSGNTAQNCSGPSSTATGDLWLEAECGNLGSLWQTKNDSQASNGKYVEIQGGNNSANSAPISANGRISFPFTAPSGNYEVWARIYTPNGADNSFWVRTDGGSWKKWHTPQKSSWQWVKVTHNSNPTTFNFLLNGNHTLDIAFREDGSKLDKIYLTKSGNPPYTGTPGNAISGLAAGLYRVLVIDDATGCSTTADITIDDEREFPVASIIGKTDQTYCGTAANGTISATVIGNNNDYDFYWFSGTINNPDTTANVIAEGTQIIGLAASDYTVLTAHKQFRCVSSPVFEEVEDKTIKPSINASVIAEQTACDPAKINGEFSASVDASLIGGTAADTLSYTFQWYAGVTTLTTLPPTATRTEATPSQLAAGDYSLVVTNDSTNCKNIKYINLQENKIKPKIDKNTISVTDATRCSDPWGSSIAVTADGGNTSANNYVFEWRDAVNTVLPETSEVLSNIKPSTYTVLVTNPLGCVAVNKETIKVKNNTTPPTVTLTPYNNTTCVAGSPNGIIITKDFIGLASAYNFEWFFNNTSGANVPLAKISTDGDTVINLSASNYALRITDKATDCATTAFSKILNKPTVPPVVDTVLTKPTNFCTDPQANGEVEFMVTGGPKPLPYDTSLFRTYTYTLYKGPDTSGSLVGMNSTGIFTGLNAGDYTVTLEDDFTHCVSNEMTIFINQDPLVDIVFDNWVPPAGCNVSTGELQVYATSPQNNDTTGGPGYIFDWYFRGNPLLGPLPGTPNPGNYIFEDNFNTQKKDLEPGYYTVEAFDNFSQCNYSENFYLPIANPPTVALIDTTSSNQCDPGNGAALVQIAKTGTSLTLDNYNIEIYKGNSVDPANLISTWTPLDDTDNQHSFTGLNPTNYIATVSAGVCYGMQVPFKIDMVNPPITVNITEDIPDFTCNANGTGQLSAAVIGGGDGDNTLANFSFDWFVGTDTSGMGFTPTPVTPNTLSADVYTVKITDNSGPGTGCTAKSTYILENKPKDIRITALNIIPTNQCLPNGNGEIYVSEISEDGTPISNIQLGDYTFDFFDEVLNPILGNAGNGTATNPYNLLVSETYNIIATNSLTDCESEVKQGIIEDVSQNPDINIALIQPDFSCDGANPTGELLASAEDPVDSDPTNFDFNWYVGNTVSGISISNTANTSNNLLTGEYTVHVLDTAGSGKNCESTSTITLDQKRRTIELVLNSKDQDVCAPDVGAITVTQVNETDSFNGTQTQNVNTYDFELFDEDLVSLANNPPGPSNDLFASLAPAVYYVRGSNAGTDNCTSLPFITEIKDVSKNPNVGIREITKQYSNSTDPTTWTGALEAVVTVHPKNPLDSLASPFTYGYNWYEAENYNPGSEISSSTNVSALDSGLYVLEVVNKFTNCRNSSTFYLEKQILYPELAFNVLPQTICRPDGSVEVVSMTVNGVPANQSDFIFTLYTGTYPSAIADTLDGAILTSAQLYDSLSSDYTYYIEAFEKNLQITSEVTQLDVSDISTFPNISLNQVLSKDQSSCDPTVNQNGALAIDVYEDDYTQGLYEYVWYRGQNLDPANIMTDSIDNYITGLGSDYFSVKVRNTNTNCEASSFFFVNQSIQYPNVIVSTTPSTICSAASGNGIIAGFISNNISEYRLDWFSGPTASNQVEFSGKIWENRTPGTYTVIATDLKNTTCVSAPKSGIVGDESVLPVVSIYEDAPLSNCDPKNPNGQLSATVNGLVDGYKFVWYDSNNKLIKIGPSASNLIAGQYRVEALNLATLCIGTAQYQLSEQFEIVSQPDVAINSALTSCDFPDGEAEASVKGNITGYIFTWFDGKGKVLPNPEPNHIITGLTAGNYSVTATNRQTGCSSEPVTFTITDETFKPVFAISATPAICNADNGSLTITFSDFDTAPDRIVWYNEAKNQIIGENLEVSDVNAGNYYYEVFGTNGCKNSGSFTVTSEVNVYNGVTPNGDSDNDIFEIGCIEDFPDNTVKIFNRAGTLVYEAQGYDNASTFFEGNGNRGIYVGGRELPDGTYFYIIQKDKGSKVLTGYLELVR